MAKDKNIAHKISIIVNSIGVRPSVTKKEDNWTAKEGGKTKKKHPSENMIKCLFMTTIKKISKWSKTVDRNILIPKWCFEPSNAEYTCKEGDALKNLSLNVSNVA